MVVPGWERSNGFYRNILSLTKVGAAMIVVFKQLAFDLDFGRVRAQRITDLVVASGALLIVGWAMLLVALIIRCDSRGPVFFVQQRLGRRQQPFNCIKFRTMHVNAERDTGPVWATRSDPRVTRVGRVLRRSRIDELPQLFNVLRGEMAIVGPRPIRRYFVDELSALDPRFEQRFEVKPGLTGWAQVSLEYPSTVSAQLEKLDYDLYYIKHRSFWFDLKIMVLTCGVVLGLRGS
jgi:lipopolysaccharide/colanic/teichoic acid biosynthesis glycosyltransferase